MKIIHGYVWEVWWQFFRGRHRVLYEVTGRLSTDDCAVAATDNGGEESPERARETEHRTQARCQREP
ncbi:MAG TPA: hypothetical protein VFW98_18635 [Gemmatimonadaceae bacterium]|nr:hypothetical protein [Gemmatimonadaceae bacterium]